MQEKHEVDTSITITIAALKQVRMQSHEVIRA